jgi:hypothetical protein
MTPLSSRADRDDERVNRSVGLLVGTPRELDEAIRETCVEAMLLVEELYGYDGVVEV